MQIYFVTWLLRDITVYTVMHFYFQNPQCFFPRLPQRSTVREQPYSEELHPVD